MKKEKDENLIAQNKKHATIISLKKHMKLVLL